MTKIAIIYYSSTGHTYQLARAIEEGAVASGADVRVRKVCETASAETIAANPGWKLHLDATRDVQEATLDDLEWADGFMFGTPTRFGNMCAQMRNFLDQTGSHWMSGALIGKVGSVFTSTASQHGGQETTIQSFHTTLLHQGMIIVGLPYSAKELMTMAEITGGTPYGASTITSGDGSRQPSANELTLARFQGKHVAEIAAKLFG